MQEHGLQLLKVLDLSYNRFSKIPFCLPAGLKALYMGNNAIYEVPDWFCQRMTTLVYMDLQLNLIAFLPKSLASLSKLTMLALGNNPFLQGTGRLSSAAADGQNGRQIVRLAGMMSETDWATEFRRLRECVADVYA